MSNESVLDLPSLNLKEVDNLSLFSPTNSYEFFIIKLNPMTRKLDKTKLLFVVLILSLNLSIIPVHAQEIIPIRFSSLTLHDIEEDIAALLQIEFGEGGLWKGEGKNAIVPMIQIDRVQDSIRIVVTIATSKLSIAELKQQPKYSFCNKIATALVFTNETILNPKFRKINSTQGENFVKDLSEIGLTSLHVVNYIETFYGNDEILRKRMIEVSYGRSKYNFDGSRAVIEYKPRGLFFNRKL